MGILAIIAQLLRDQAELAAILADTQVLDVSRRNRLLTRVRQNQEHFQNFVDNYKLPVEKRTSAPTPACQACVALQRKLP
jgi:hypothetical protein